MNQNNAPDELSLSALHYLKNEQEEAIDIYKKIFMDKKYDALNIYLAMCYYKLEFYDIALDLVNHYLSIHNDSIVANKLKAAIENSSTGNDKAAKDIILNLQKLSKSSDIFEDNDLLKHNLAFFDNDPDSKYNKLKIFSNLLDIIPDARQNLIIYYLRNGLVNPAFNLIKDMQPLTTKD